MKFTLINFEKDLSEIVQVLNVSHATVAKEFGFTKKNNPSNNAFIDETELRSQLNEGIELFALLANRKIIGCIAIEKSSKVTNLFYIEKVSIVPEYRNQGYGVQLMNFAISKIKESGGREVSVALIDSNRKLKKWYTEQGFIETVTRDFEHLPFHVCFMNKQI